MIQKMTNCHDWYDRKDKFPRSNMYGGNMGNGYHLYVNINWQPS